MPQEQPVTKLQVRLSSFENINLPSILSKETSPIYFWKLLWKCLQTGGHFVLASTWKINKNMADSRLAPSQWETSLQSNTVSHWLGANLQSALKNMPICSNCRTFRCRGRNGTFLIQSSSFWFHCGRKVFGTATRRLFVVTEFVDDQQAVLVVADLRVFTAAPLRYPVVIGTVR